MLFFYQIRYGRFKRRIRHLINAGKPKKTRLYQRKAITTRDTRDKLKQRNLGGLMGKEKSGNSGHEKRQRQGQRYCGICEKPGHNVRTCEKGKKKGNRLE